MLFCSVRLLLRTASSAYLLCNKLFHTLTYQALVLRLGLGSAVSYEDFRIEDACADVSWKKCQHKYSAFSLHSLFSPPCPPPPPHLFLSRAPPLLKRRWCCCRRVASVSVFVCDGEVEVEEVGKTDPGREMLVSIFRSSNATALTSSM